MDNNRPDAIPGNSVIRFACNFCGQKIRVPARLAGKRGKCPKCRSIIVIPAVNATPRPQEPDKPIRLNRDLDGTTARKQHETEANQTHPNTPENEQYPDLHLRPAVEPARQVAEPDIISYAAGLSETQPQPRQETDIPWFIDMLAYPFSIGGIIHFIIFWLAPVLLSFIGPFLFLMCCYGQLAAMALYILLGGYMLYYFFNCIIESAKGARRAPDVSLQDPPTPVELLRKVLLVLACNILCFAPLIIYVIWFFWTRIRVSPGASLSQFDLTSNIAFWGLYGAGVFLLPMTLLAVAMFDSLSALSPGLFIPSIFSTLLPYCGLVILFYGIGYLSSRIRPIAGAFGILYWGLQIYVMFILFHLLGLFFRRYEDKLNWEIKL